MTKDYPADEKTSVNVSGRVVRPACKAGVLTSRGVSLDGASAGQVGQFPGIGPSLESAHESRGKGVFLLRRHAPKANTGDVFRKMTASKRERAGSRLRNSVSSRIRCRVEKRRNFRGLILNGLLEFRHERCLPAVALSDIPLIDQTGFLVEFFSSLQVG